MRRFLRFKSQKVKSGFTMIELILVGAIVITMGMLYMQAQVREQNITQARNIGKQMSNLSDALNAYVVNRFAGIANTSASDANATANGTSKNTAFDPGPRTCVDVAGQFNNATPALRTTRFCDITLRTLVNDGLLPANFDSLPPFRSSGGLDGYMISLRVTSGSDISSFANAMLSPNIEAMVQTRNAWTNGTRTDYNLIGEAVRAIGPDGGAVGISGRPAGTMMGYLGGWSMPTLAGTTATAGTAYNFGTVGRFGVRAGFGSSMFYQFLRRDGTLPMTGDLNMGGRALYNAASVSTVNASDTQAATAKCKVTELTADGSVVVRQYGGAGSCTDVAFLSANGRADLQTGAPVNLSTSQGSTANINGNLNINNNGGKMVTVNNLDNIRLASFGGASNVPLKNLLPTYVAHDVWVVGNGQAVNKPSASSCSAIGGVPKVVVTPAVSTARIGYVQGADQTNPYGRIFLYQANGFAAWAQDVGSQWIIYIQGWSTWDDSLARAVVHVYCAFPQLEKP